MVNVAIVQGRLYEAGIMAMVTNEFSANVFFNVVGTRISEFWPELWVNESDREKAIALIQEFQSGAQIGKPWKCAGCGEEIEGQFDACWNCGAGRPDK